MSAHPVLTDVVIVGAGVAGSTAVAMLGHAGIDAVAIDPKRVFGADFRCEKLDASQLALLRQTGLARAVLQAGTPYRSISVARSGRIVDSRQSEQCGILYDTLVNTVRGQVGGSARMVEGKVAAISTSGDRQRVLLSDEREISARLVVLANGLNIALRDSLGLRRELISPCHSISIGFDLEPVGADRFPFEALTYYSDRPADRVAYMTLFPTGPALRANLFVYREFDDPFLQRMRHAPDEALAELFPGLSRAIGAFRIIGPVRIRPADLYATSGHRQPGFVLVGDAYASSCPAAGTGLNKVLTDVERLCHVHIPSWLASPGMSAAKIAEFYDDPVKIAADRHSFARAFHTRSLAIDSGVLWRLKRHGRALGRRTFGLVRRLRNASRAKAAGRQVATSGVGHPTGP